MKGKGFERGINARDMLGCPISIFMLLTSTNNNVHENLVHLTLPQRPPNKNATWKLATKTHATLKIGQIQGQRKEGRGFKRGEGREEEKAELQGRGRVGPVHAAPSAEQHGTATTGNANLHEEQQHSEEEEETTNTHHNKAGSRH